MFCSPLLQLRIAGFNPGQSADTLYVTNGETTDYADVKAGTIAYTPSSVEEIPGAGFVFPDDENLIQAEFTKTLLPPESCPVGEESGRARLIGGYHDQAVLPGPGRGPDPQNGQQSLFDFTFAVSYGNPQEYAYSPSATLAL